MTYSYLKPPVTATSAANVTKYVTKPHDAPVGGKRANGRVVKRGGITKVLKHAPYAKAKLEAPVLKNYVLPVNGYR